MPPSPSPLYLLHAHFTFFKRVENGRALRPTYVSFFVLFCLFETACHVAQAALDFSRWPRVTLNSAPASSVLGGQIDNITLSLCSAGGWNPGHLHPRLGEHSTGPAERLPQLHCL